MHYFQTTDNDCTHPPAYLQLGQVNVKYGGVYSYNCEEGYIFGDNVFNKDVSCMIANDVVNIRPDFLCEGTHYIYIYNNLVC